MRWNAITLCLLPISLLGVTAKAQPPVQDAETMIKSSLVLLYAAVYGEDVGVLQQLLYAPQDREQKLAAAQARRIVASVRFQRAAEGKMSPQELAPVWEQLRIVPGGAFLSMLMGEWKVVGDRATTEIPELAQEKLRAPPLINVRGIWRVNLLPDGPVGDIDALAAAVDRSTALIEQAATGIAQDKLRTKEQIQALIHGATTFAASNYEPDVVLTLPAASRD